MNQQSKKIPNLLTGILFSLLTFFPQSGLAAVPGEQLWHALLPTEFGSTWSTPVVVMDRVFQQDQDGGMHCYDAGNGALLWSTVLLADSWPTSSPVYRNSKLYALAANKLFKVDPGCGAVEAIFTPEDDSFMANLAPAISDTMAFIGTNTTFFAIDLVTFEVVWSKPIAYAQPLLADDRIYLFADKLYCLNNTDGEEMWQLPPPSGTMFRLGAMSGDIIVAHTNKTEYPDYLPAKLHAFQISTEATVAPSVLWSYEYPGGTYADNAPPAIDGEMVFTATREGVLRGFTLTGTGTPVWERTIRASGSAPAQPVAIDGKVLFQDEMIPKAEVLPGETDTTDTAMVCVQGADGTEIWKTIVPDMAMAWGTPAVADDKVYVATDWGNGLYAFYGGSIAGNWRMVRQNPNQNGSSSGWQKSLFNAPWLLGGGGDNPNTAFGASDQPPSRVGFPEYQVNTASLNLVLQGSMFWMKTRGPSIAAGLTYNADPSQSSVMFGRSWRFDYESTISSCNAKTLQLKKGSGQALTYSTDIDLTDPDTPPSYPVEMKPPTGNFDKMTVRDGYIDWWEKNSRFTYRYQKSTTPDLNVYYLSSITDRNGNAVTLEVNLSNGQINSIADPAGRTLSFAYDPTTNHCTQITLPAYATNNSSTWEATVLFAYEPTSGNLVTITDRDGNEAAYEYDEDHFLTKMTIDDRWTSFEYQIRGSGMGKYVAKVQDSDNTWEAYEILRADPIKIRRTSRFGRARIFESKDGQTSAVTDPLGNLAAVTFLNKLPVSFSDRNGKIEKFEYDNRGNVSKQTDAEGNSTTFYYDLKDNLTSRRTPLNATWYYSYDSNSNLIRMTSPLGYITALAYNSSDGQIKSTTDAKGAITLLAHDDYGNLTSITDPLGNLTSFSFRDFAVGTNSYWRCRKITDALGQIKYLDYDNLDRLTRVTYDDVNDGPFYKNEFDAFAQTAFTDENGNRTTVNRNRHSFITRQTPPLGNATTFTYDSDNNRTAMTDPLNRRTETTYDDDSRPTRVTDPLGGIVRRTYDKEGNLVTLKDQRDNTTTFTYDDNGRLLTTTDPLGNVVTHVRDQEGRIVSTTNARGQVVAFTYDQDGRKIRKDYDGTEVASYTYNEVGNLTAMGDATGTIAYTYDARNKVTAITYPDGLTVSYTYDALGNPATITYPGAITVVIGYDSYNRIAIPSAFRNTPELEFRENRERGRMVTSMTWGDQSANFTYDPAMRLTAASRSNQTATTYTYDANDRLTGVEHTFPASAPLTLAYTYNEADATTSITDSNPVTSQPPDLSQTADYNSANQIVSLGGEAYDHNADGNLASMGTRFSATYDQENRPLSISRNGETITYQYNGLGQRVSRTVAEETRLAHFDRDGKLLFETDTTGTVTAMHIYAGQRLLASGTAATGFHFYHFDRNGNTLAVSAADGTILGQYAYAPYGEVTTNNPALENPFTFVGAHGVIDEGEGLFMMKKRFYDANVGRFIQKDPIGFTGGINLYQYGAGNPVDFIDPEGDFFALTMTLLAAGMAYTGYKVDEMLEESNKTKVSVEKFVKNVSKGKVKDEDYREVREGVKKTAAKGAEVAEAAPLTSAKPPMGLAGKGDGGVGEVFDFLLSNPLKAFEDGAEFLWTGN